MLSTRCRCYTMIARKYRTGFVASDADFVDPHSPLFAVSPEPRFADDPTLAAPVLERNNVGLGSLQVSEISEISISMLYRKLRNLEVNTTKRLVTVTDTRKTPAPRKLGNVSNKNLILMCEAAADEDNAYMLEYLKSLNDLAVLVRDYRKPLVTLCASENAALPWLSPFAAVEATEGDASSFRITHTALGFTPIGGLSYVLGRLPQNLGPFLALTQTRLSGQDLVFAGLSKYVMAREALAFLETTGADFQRVAECDVAELLSDHFLTISGKFTLTEFLPVISDCFGYRTVNAVKRRLHEYLADFPQQPTGEFAAFCLRKLDQVPVLAGDASLALIASVADAVRDKGDSLDVLVEALRLETRVALRIIKSPELRLRLSKLFGLPDAASATSVDFDALFEPLRADDYHYVPRSEFSLSGHPKLRRYHPDFDPATGLDHDPGLMATLVKRWGNDAFLSELRRETERRVMARM